MADEVTISVRAEDNFSGVLGDFGSIMTGIESVVNLAAQAFSFAKDIIGDFVNSASESEQAVARLDGVLRATGGAVGLTSEELQGMADSLQNVTRFSDETILNGEAILLTFRNLSGEMFERTVPAMLDMAEIFGSVDSAAMQLGKALNDPVAGLGALSRAGIQFSEEQKEMIKQFVEMGDIASAQNIILGEVEAQVSGLAETMGQTFGGQIDIFKNRLDTLKEMIGGAFLPAFTELTGVFSDFVASPAVIQFFEDVAVSIGDTVTRILEFLDLTQTETSTLLTPEFFYGGQSPTEVQTEVLRGMDEILAGIQNKIILWWEGIDWQALRDSIETGVLSAIENVDWNSLGLSFRSHLQEFFNGERVSLMSDEVNASMGSAFTELLAGVFGYINWESLMVDFRAGLEASFAMTFGYLRFEDWGADLYRGFDYLGQQILAGLAQSFGYAEWQEFANDFVEGFQLVVSRVKSFLGISSPSTVFAGIGRDIISGLISGWTSAIGNFINTIENSIEDIISIFPDWLQDAIGLDASGLGSAGGGTAPDSGTGTGGNGQVVNNYFYGTVYIGSSLDDANYDCPSPNPLVGASGNQLVVTGY